MEARKINYPVNLLETEVCDEVRELLGNESLGLNSAHQSWLLMAVLYLVERERRKTLRSVSLDGLRGHQGAEVLPLHGGVH